MYIISDDLEPPLLIPSFRRSGSAAKDSRIGGEIPARFRKPIDRTVVNSKGVKFLPLDHMAAFLKCNCAILGSRTFSGDFFTYVYVRVSLNMS